MEHSKIIQNAVHIPEDDTYIISRHTHDFVTHVFKSDPTLEISVDGGQAYFKRSGDFDSLVGRYEEWSLTDGDPFELVAQRLLWGVSRGIGEPWYRPLASLTVEHLRNILTHVEKHQTKLSPTYASVIAYWIRKKSDAAAKPTT